jgi:hypothetical protein
MFNELTILLIAIMLPAFTTFVTDPHIKYQIGWVVLGIIGINTIVNFVIVIKLTINGIKKMIKKKYCYRRKKSLIVPTPSFSNRSLAST